MVILQPSGNLLDTSACYDIDNTDQYLFTSNHLRTRHDVHSTWNSLQFHHTIIDIETKTCKDFNNLCVLHQTSYLTNSLKTGDRSINLPIQLYIYRQSSVKTQPIKKISSNNTLHLLFDVSSIIILLSLHRNKAHQEPSLCTCLFIGEN